MADDQKIGTGFASVALVVKWRARPAERKSNDTSMIMHRFVFTGVGRSNLTRFNCVLFVCCVLFNLCEAGCEQNMDKTQVCEGKQTTTKQNVGADLFVCCFSVWGTVPCYVLHVGKKNFTLLNFGAKMCHYISTVHGFVLDFSRFFHGVR